MKLTKISLTLLISGLLSLSVDAQTFGPKITGTGLKPDNYDLVASLKEANPNRIAPVWFIRRRFQCTKWVGHQRHGTESSLYLVHLLDFVSVFLADMNQVDAVEVKVIDFLKAELAKSWKS